MANASAAGRSANAVTATWSDLGQITDDKREWWRRQSGRTDWMACGVTWDAVSISPMPVGLAALSAARTDPRGGYMVLADHVKNVLYVLVPPGTGNACEGIVGVRVLSRGYQLLVPERPEHSTIAADWISHPAGDKPARLVQAEQFAAHLRDLTTPTHERAVAS
ncbi:hypothetical protein [Streptomyces xanthochromogenes]|uniref:hypothetical protein n=1 Tax=Streptomyces xanthochromogenes TaxID=67384 RepID=UPI00343C9054